MQSGRIKLHIGLGIDRRQRYGALTNRLANTSGHSTQKPVECMRRPIENNSSPGQAVYDPFVGSGTTIIAAEMTGSCLSCDRDQSHLLRCDD